MPRAALPPQRRDRAVAGLEKEIAAAEASYARWLGAAEASTAAGRRCRREQGMLRLAEQKLHLLLRDSGGLLMSRDAN